MYGRPQMPNGMPFMPPAQQQPMPNAMPDASQMGGMPQQTMAPMPAVQALPQPAQMAPFRGQGFTPPSPVMQQQQMVRGLFGLPGGR